MTTMLISLLVVFIILGLAYWAIHRLAAAFGIPAPIIAVIDVILVIIAVLYLIRYLVPLASRL